MTSWWSSLPWRSRQTSFAAGAEAGVDGQDAFAAERRGEQQFAQVVGEDADGFLVGFLLGLEPHLGLHGRARAGACSRPARPGGPARRPACLDALTNSGSSNGQRLFLGRRDAHHEESLLLAAAHGQQAVAGDLGQRLAPVEVVLELGAGLLPCRTRPWSG